jgi:hypothetical protein
MIVTVVSAYVISYVNSTVSQLIRSFKFSILKIWRVVTFSVCMNEDCTKMW